MSQKVQLNEILSLEEYAKQREEIRKKIFQIKSSRRFHLGDMFTFLFENKDTVWYQIQEMLRAERITEEKAIQHEIDTYNELIANPGEIKVTLLIEIDDPDFRKYKLKELVGLEKHIFLFFKDKENNIHKIPAEFDERQFNRERISSVQYITFRLESHQQELFLKATEAGIQVTHPAYYHTGTLNQDQLQAVKEDFQIALL